MHARNFRINVKIYKGVLLFSRIIGGNRFFSINGYSLLQKQNVVIRILSILNPVIEMTSI